MNSPALPEKFEVLESGLIPGWKKLEAREPLHQFEATSQGMNWRSLPQSSLAGYVVHYPGEWTFDGFSVFYDRENNKVAELAPLALTEISAEEILRNYQPSEIYGEEPIAQEMITFEHYGGLKLIEKVRVMYGKEPYWYPHTYLISDGRHLFAIIFYAYELKERDQELFDQIAATLSFR